MEQPPHAPPKLNEDILHQIFQHCDKDTAVAFSFVNKATLAVATSRFRAQLSPLDIVLHVRYPDRAYLRKKYLRASQPGEVKTGTRWDIATEEELDWICWRKRDLNVITFEEWKRPSYITLGEWTKGLPGYDGYQGVKLPRGSASLVHATSYEDTSFGSALREIWSLSPEGPSSEGFTVRDFRDLYTGRYAQEPRPVSRFRKILGRFTRGSVLAAGTIPSKKWAMEPRLIFSIHPAGWLPNDTMEGFEALGWGWQPSYFTF